MWPFGKKKNKNNTKQLEVKQEDSIVEEPTPTTNVEKRTSNKITKKTTNTNNTASKTKEITVRPAKYRVMYNAEDKCWDIKRDGAKRVIRKVKTKVEALRIVDELAKNQNTSVVVHKKDGKFQKR